MKIKYCKDNRLGCYLAERTFSEVELKFLLDSVDKSEILSKSEEEQLKTKILSLASESMKKFYPMLQGVGHLASILKKAVRIRF